MKTPMRLITISDIHIGHQDVERNRIEFEPFIEEIHKVAKKCKKDKILFGGVAITGDLFDHQISVNSSHAKFAMQLIHDIASIVDEYNGMTILLRGTRSHDLDQLMIFQSFEHQFEHFYIVNELATIDINDYKVLLIPEEYMKNQEEYYEEAFADKYDIILAHGFLKFNCFSKNEVERSMPDMPIFDQEELIEVARISIFGHDHKYKTYRDKIYYNGSWSRLCHGEEDEKGALLLYIDENKTKVTRIINKLTPIYRSVYLDKLVEAAKLELTFENAVKTIRQFKIDDSIDFLKIKISNETVETNPTLVSLVISAFNTQYKKMGIIIESPPFSIKDGKSVLLLRETDEESGEIEKVESEYDFLFDTKLELDEKILSYLNLKTNVDSSDIDIDDIRDAISDID